MSTLRTPVGEGDYVQGPADARVTLLEYGDYECPYCGAAYPIVKQLQHRFADQLRFAFRNFPLANAHPNAMDAASAAEFAGEQGRFWEMHDGLYEHQQHLGPALYVALAERLGLDAVALLAAIDDGRYHAKIRAQFTGGVRSGVNGTPTFFIDGTRFDGADFRQLGAELAQAIDDAGV
jgi:protein-disulfide isomerase